MENSDLLLEEVLQHLKTSRTFSGPFASEDAFEDAVWKHLWTWATQRCGPDGPWAGKSPGNVLLTSHSARIERDPMEWALFARSPERHADARVLDSYSRVDMVIRPPNGEPTIGVEVERIKPNPKGKKPGASELGSGLGQATLTLLQRQWAILIVHWPTSGDGAAISEDRETKRAALKQIESLFRDGRLRVLVVP